MMMCDQILKHFASYKQVPTYEELLKDEDLMRMLNISLSCSPETEEKTEKKLEKKVEKKAEKKAEKKVEKKAEKKAEKKTPSPKLSIEERQKTSVDDSRCLCRLWKGGLDNVQCTGRKKDGNFCGRHAKFGDNWWLGLITESRPEEPFGPPTSDKPGRHYWSDQEKPVKKKKTPVKKEKVKKEIVKKEEKVVSEEEHVVEKKVVEEEVVDVKPKKKRTVKVESSEEENNVEKDISLAGGVGIIPEKSMSPEKDTSNDTDECDSVLDEFTEDEDDVEVVKDYEFEGVIYKHLLKDDLIMDWNTGCQMGYLKEGVLNEFFDDDARKIHEENKK